MIRPVVIVPFWLWAVTLTLGAVIWVTLFPFRVIHALVTDARS